MQHALIGPATLFTVFSFHGAATAHADASGPGWHHGTMGWSGWFFGPLMMVVFFALLIGAVIIIARLLGSGDDGADRENKEDRSLAILRERFANGEITKDEFEDARKTLER